MTGAASQIPLPFDHRPGLGGEDFLVAACNADAVAWIDRWPDWPGPALAVAGPSGSGKTHLGAVWAARSGARTLAAANLTEEGTGEIVRGGAPLIIDDAERLAGDPARERALFHLLNGIASERGRLLLLGSAPPARWPARLRDLRSRLAAVPVAEIRHLDEALMGALLVKLFADRQLRVGTDVIRYALPRMERSFDAARRLVAAADRQALAEGRAVTVPLIRRLLAAAE